MSLYLGENLISGVATPIEGARNIGQIIQSTIPLTDAGLHLLDGAVISGDGVYGDFYNYIAGIVNTYPQIFCQEHEWQAEVASHGVCGKFVFDDTNRTVRLPLITGITQSSESINALGDYIQAGLPNITGSLRFSKTGFPTATYDPVGAFGKENTPTNGFFNLTSDSTTRFTTLTFNASNSNSIYGNSSTVQPPAIKVLYYIVLATSTKTDIQVDIDEIATELNNKLDKNDLATVHCVIETYVNGTSWYRVYDDGWCEQGGITGTGVGSISLLVNFIDLNYIVLANVLSDDTQQAWNNQVNIKTKTTNSFIFPATSTKIRQWRACGYIS